MEDLQGYFVGALKRRAVEVSERRLSAEELQQFREAKAAEVKNFVASGAFESLPEHLRPSKEQAIGMRWVLTWKHRDDGSVKAKARAILLGYQDPCYEHRDTTSPVMTRQTRQFQLQLAALKNWKVYKGDVTGAFLQGREYPDTLYCIPCPEICTALGLAEGSVTKLRRACYGLLDAPLEWYRTVVAVFEELGLERQWADACSWVYRVNGSVRGMISGHVDDFLFSGREDDAGWQEIISNIKQRFKWGDWDHGTFVQCGVQVEQTTEGFLLSQRRYVEGIKEIPVNSSRRKDKGLQTTGHEQTQLRALLGALSWHAQQVAPHMSAEVSLLLSEVKQSTVNTILRANQLLEAARARKEHRLRIHRFAEGTPLGLFAWVDAASQNRPDGGSTQGIVIGLAPESLLQGEMAPVSAVAWHSNRIDRVCRSPGSAETQAAVNGEDLLYYARFQWSELLYGSIDTKGPDSCVSKVLGCVITDSRNVFDKLRTEVLSIKGAERRANLELLSLKESQLRTGLHVRWVHSEAQLSNSLTKSGAGKEMGDVLSHEECVANSGRRGHAVGQAQEVGRT